jgi:Pectate lyase superfamily protein
MAVIYTNNAVATVTNGGTSAPASGYTESWTVATTSFPSVLTSGDYFHVADPVLTTEKIRVTGITGTGPYVWSVTRGDEGTTPVAHTSGFTAYEVATSSDLMTGGADWYNVKAPIYGATGNGTTDDTAAIKAAITAATTSTVGGTIYFPVGKYLISSSLPCGGNYSNGGLEFRGAGYSSEITLANSANCYMFDMGNATGGPVLTVGARFSDLYLNCNGANQATSSTNGGGIYARGAVWCLFEHLWIEEPWEGGIRFYQDGLGNYGHHNTIRDCLFRDGANVSAHGQGWAVKLEQCDENTLEGNTFQNCCQPLSQGHDTQVYDTSAGLQSIIGNHFVGGGTGATMIKSDSSPSRVQIVGNQFDGPYNASCVEIDGAAATIVGNIFLNIGQQATGLVAGVHVGGTSGVKIIGNSFSNFSVTNATCVYADSGNTQTHMADNDVVGSWTSLTLFTAPSTSGSMIARNTGYNPVGGLAAPNVPASTTSLLNPFNVDSSVFITGGTVTQIKIGSGTTGLTTTAGVTQQIWLPAGQSVTMTYSSTPTWVWIGN